MSMPAVDSGGTSDPISTSLPQQPEVASENDEEQNHCRICRGEGTTTQPLYHPCKCSGSIKFVHQECLMEWLSHSQKKYCELCKTSFRFTKLYDRSMPAKLPFPLFLRQLARHGLRESIRWTRYLFVSVIWLCLLPWCIRHIWRAFFWLADGPPLHGTQSQDPINDLANATLPQAAQSSWLNLTIPERFENIKFVLPPLQLPLADFSRAVLSHGLIGRVLQDGFGFFMSSTQAAHAVPVPHTASNQTSTMPIRLPSLLSDVDFVSSWSTSQQINNVTIDIIEGQLICVLLVTAFILVFLIREWVINQQPILNMPDAEAADAGPQQDQPADNDRPRRGFRRVRNRRHPLNANVGDGEGAAAATDDAMRPTAVPRRRRALTDDNILIPRRAELERPTLPGRSRSLAAAHDDDNIFENEAVGTGTTSNWNQHNSSSLTQHATPLQSIDATQVLAPEAEGLDTAVLPAVEITPPQPPETPTTDGVHDEPFVPAESIIAESLPAHERPADEQENADSSTDSSGVAIHTPGSLDSTEDLQPPVESSDTALQPNVLNEIESEAEEEATPADRPVRIVKLSPINQLMYWLWNTDFDEETFSAADAALPAAIEHEDEVRIVADVNEEAPFVPVRNADVHPAPAPPQDGAAPEIPVAAREPNIFLGVDLNDPNAADDMEDLDGVLELLGLEGPIFGMLQNVVFSMFLITLTLVVSVWTPYIWGKIALLFLSHPTSMFIRAPIFVLSRSADIVADVIFFVAGLAGIILTQPAKVAKTLIGLVLPSIGNLIDTAAVEGFTLDLSQKSGNRLEKTLTNAVLSVRPDVSIFSLQSHYALLSLKTFVREGVDWLGNQTSESWQVAATEKGGRHVLRQLPELLYRLPQLGNLTKWFGNVLAEDLFAEPGLDGQGLDPALAVWNTEDRIITIVLGYMLFAIAGIVFLEIAHLFLGLKDNEKVEGYLADSLRQAGGVMKVIVIIGIEMLMFPLYCGLLLDVALLPLFANTTIGGRLAFMIRTPLTGIFIHWFLGTCYMFHFALFVSICRKIMRKGVLYFIRDPDDPTFHPVRDVLERPVPAQLGKIAFSAIVYGGLVLVCLGGVVWSLDWVGGVLPIQWSTPEPRLAFPVDIVFYNFLLPFILRKAEPSKKISIMYRWWFRGCAASLRLTHFLFGEERKEEQYTHPSRILGILGNGNASVEPQRDGTWVRAPGSDSVRIAKGRDVFLEVTEENERVDGKPDSETGMHGKNDPQFTKVYLPPNFKGRITTFIVLLWLFAATTGIAFTIGPLLAGRKITQLIAQSSAPPNDLYAFTVGVHAFAVVGYGIAYAGTARDYLMAKLDSSGRQLLNSVKHICGLFYLGTFTTLVLPFVLALITELYIHMPLFDILELANRDKAVKAAPSTASTNTAKASGNRYLPAATIFILQTWTVGLLYLRILYRVLLHVFDGHTQPGRAVRAITRHGIFQADVQLASRAFVLPATTICVILLAFPPAYMKVIITLMRIQDNQARMRMYRFAYPLFLWMVVNYAGVVFLRRRIEAWRVKIRDEVYLIGERLHNFQEPRKQRKVDRSKLKGKSKGPALSDTAQA